MQAELKKQGALLRLLERKTAREAVRMKSTSLTRWKAFVRDLEMFTVKTHLKRLSSEVETLKF